MQYHVYVTVSVEYHLQDRCVKRVLVTLRGPALLLSSFTDDLPSNTVFGLVRSTNLDCEGAPATCQGIESSWNASMADYSVQYAPVRSGNSPYTSFVYHQPCTRDKQEGRLTRHKRQLIFAHAATSPLSHVFLTAFVLRTLHLVPVRPRLAVPATAAYIVFFRKLCLLQTRFTESFRYGRWPNNVTEAFFTGCRYLKNMQHYSPLNAV